MSKLKLVLLVALVIALTALAVFGAGWKWRGKVQAASQEHVAGWTWEMRASKHQ